MDFAQVTHGLEVTLDPKKELKENGERPGATLRGVCRGVCETGRLPRPRHAEGARRRHVHANHQHAAQLIIADYSRAKW